MRIVSRLDIKNDYLIKGLALEGLRKLGNAKDFAKKYYQFGIDEIIYIDTVASLYSREGIFKILMETVQEVFVPITVGGGIRTVNDAYKYFASLLHNNKFKINFRLNAGDIFCFNNRRVLHGRTEFDPNSGHRHLQGYYMDRDEIRGRLSFLENQID